MKLFHTGYQEIKEPDVHYGRKNADFGQGFYMTAEYEFASRWARAGKDVTVYVNHYELDTEGLKIHRFERSQELADYILDNRACKKDSLPDIDVVIGPIANDTIYDTMGIISSGLLGREQSLCLLMVGPEYRQIVLKTEAAAGKLRWLGSEILPNERIHAVQAQVAEEEAVYQKQLVEAMKKL